MSRYRSLITRSVACVCLFAIVSLDGYGDDWPRFRGPNGTGVAPALAIPDSWTDADYVWTAQLPGTGHGSPVVFSEQVYITSGDPSSGALHLEAYSAETGGREWRKTIESKTFSMHASNSYASSTPAVDDQHVYVSVGNPEQVTLVAFKHSGDEVWRKELGAFSSQHGFAASPMVAGSVVCLQGDTEAGGYLVALDTATGEEKWRASRPAGKESYATPAVIEPTPGKIAIVVTSMMNGIEAIDAETGQQLWQQAGTLPARTVSSPIVAGDLVLAACGGGGNGKQLTAIRSSDADSSEQAFTLTRNVPYVPTGVICDGLLFLWHERGTVTCVELATQDELWTKRVGGKYFSSPIVMGDRLLNISMNGEAVMLRAARQFEELGRTDLGEGTEATAAAVDGRLLLRTATKLMCLEAN